MRGSRPPKPIRAYLTVKSLSAIRVFGSGDVHCPSLKTEDLALSIAGSGDITCKTEAKRLSADCAGSGDFSLDATADHVKLSVAGSGDMNGTLHARRGGNLHRRLG